MTSTSTATAVNTKYSSIATSSTSPEYSARVAASFGYEPSQLADLPPNTNLGLSCGNPLATANLSPSDIVVDLGSGGGLDCLIAANQMVKAAKANNQPLTGKVYGVDASQEMVALATKNANKANLPSRDPSPADGAHLTTRTPATATDELVSYLHAEITEIPLPAALASLIISNCVLNLVAAALKPTAFREIYRLLQPGGRVAISDILTKKPLPEHMRQNVALVVGCVSGAASKEEYETWMVEAGFDPAKIILRATGKDLNVYKSLNGDDGVGCCGTEEIKMEKAGCCRGAETESKEERRRRGSAGVKEKLFDEDANDIDFNEWVGAYEIYAVK